MRYADMIPGSEMAGQLVERGKGLVAQKGREVVDWGAHKAINGIVEGVRVAAHVVGFALLAARCFQIPEGPGRK